MDKVKNCLYCHYIYADTEVDNKWKPTSVSYSCSIFGSITDRKHHCCGMWQYAGTDQSALDICINNTKYPNVG